MRIEAYTQVQQVYGSKKVNAAKKSEKTSQTSDQLQLSSIGKDIQIAKAAVYAAPDVREEKVASLKDAVSKGTYSVDNDSFAAKLLSKYEQMKDV